LENAAVSEAGGGETLVVKAKLVTVEVVVEVATAGRTAR
jgi:hypothetical protein